MVNYFHLLRQKLKERRLFPDGVAAVKALVKWLVLGVGTGLIVGLVGALLAHALTLVNGLRGRYPLIVLGLPAGGLAIVFLYRIFKHHDDRGTNTVVASIHSSGDIPFRKAPLVFISTVITHLFGGSAGREGAAIQLGGSIANKLGKLIKLSEGDRRAIVMGGMSAGFSALFGTPMAAALFSLEIARVGVMHYAALVPCVVASVTAHFVAGFLGVPPEAFVAGAVPAFTPVVFLKVVALAAPVAAVSVLFCVVLHTTEHLYEKLLKNPYLRIAAAGCVIVGLSLVPGWSVFLGSGVGIIGSIFSGGDAAWYAFLLKILFTALTLGAGFKGGEIVPSLCIGATFGCVVAPLLGLPSPLAAACGMAGLFCGVTNCPITSLLLAFELFGFEGMPYYLTVTAVSFMLSGYHSLYREQKFAFSKTETTE